MNIEIYFTLFNGESSKWKETHTQIVKLTLLTITCKEEQQETQKTLNVNCCGKRKLQPLSKWRMYSYIWQLL